MQENNNIRPTINTYRRLGAYTESEEGSVKSNTICHLDIGTTRRFQCGFSKIGSREEKLCVTHAQLMAHLVCGENRVNVVGRVIAKIGSTPIMYYLSQRFLLEAIKLK